MYAAVYLLITPQHMESITLYVNDTEVFRVSVMNEDPKAATRIANAIADIALRQISAIVYLSERLSQMQFI